LTLGLKARLHLPEVTSDLRIFLAGFLLDMEGYSGTAKNGILKLARQNTRQIKIYVYCGISIQILPKMMKIVIMDNNKTLCS